MRAPATTNATRSFIREYLFDLEKQEGAVWTAREYVGIRGGAPLAFVLYCVILALTVAKLPGWESALLVVGGVAVLLLVLLQRAAFHRFLAAIRKEQNDAENALTRHLNERGAADFLRATNTSLGNMKAALDKF